MNPFRYILSHQNEIEEKFSGSWSYLKCGLYEVSFNGNYFSEGTKISLPSVLKYQEALKQSNILAEKDMKAAIQKILSILKSEPITESDWLELTATEQEKFFALLNE